MRQQGSPQARDGLSVQARSSGGSRTQTVPQLPTISETLTLSLEVPAQVNYMIVVCLDILQSTARCAASRRATALALYRLLPSIKASIAALAWGPLLVRFHGVHYVSGLEGGCHHPRHNQLCLVSASRRGQSSPQKRHRRWPRRRVRLPGMHPAPLCRRLRGSMLELCRFNRLAGDVGPDACWTAPQRRLGGSVLVPCSYG